MNSKDPCNETPAVNVASLRSSATGQTLDRAKLDDDPLRQFGEWMRQACDLNTPAPNAMSLATVDRNNRPSCRTVLLEYLDEQGFVFFTNLSSKKATQIGDNENVALLFF